MTTNAYSLQPLSFTDTPQLKESDGIPAFYQFTFNLEKTGDTFINMQGWTKGIVFVNDFNIGRYWNVGPQKRLYIPAPLLRQGNNTITVFELHGTAQQSINLSTDPDLGNGYHPF